MKMTWKKKSGNKRIAISTNNLPFQNTDDDFDNHNNNTYNDTNNNTNDDNDNNNNCEEANKTNNDASLADEFIEQGNSLAQDGKYREALGKWETAITLMPQKAVLHEQKAQVLLEVGDAWGALKAATRATELDPEWAEAWTTLGRAQLNFGEPDAAIESFDKALAIKPNLVESRDDRQTALQLVKKRKQLHSLGLSSDKFRYAVVDEGESNLPGWGRKDCKIQGNLKSEEL